MKKTRLRLFVLVVAAFSLVAAACSSGGGGAALKIGTDLPQTGDLAVLGPPMIEATNMAVRDINDAGGVNGKDVELVIGDSGDKRAGGCGNRRPLDQLRPGGRYRRPGLIEDHPVRDRQDHWCRDSDVLAVEHGIVAQYL